MTVATDPRDPLDPTERELAKRLARLPQPEPAAELDARILAAARAAVTPQRRPRWGWGMGAAAAAVLCVGVFLPLWKEAQQPPPLLDEAALDVPPSAEGAPAPNERAQAPAAQQAVPATDSAASAANEVAEPPSRRDEARRVQPVAPPQAEPFVPAPPAEPAASAAAETATGVAAKSLGQSATSEREAPRQRAERSREEVVAAPPAPAAPPPPPPPAAASLAKPAPAAAGPAIAPPLADRREADAERSRAAPALRESAPADAAGPAPEAIQRELRAIRTLLAAGEREEAAQRLRTLLERHPSVELDAELRQLLELPP